MNSRVVRDLSITALRAFVAISEHGSFSKAAEQLNLTQPAISAQLKRLQQILGGDLFYKRAGGVGLSELGVLLERYARRVLTLNDQVIASTGGNRERETIRLGIQSIFVESVFPELVKICEVANKVSYKFVCASARVLAEQHKAGHVDLAFMLTPTGPRRNQCSEWNEKLVWVRAPHMFPILNGEIPFVGHHQGTIDGKVLEVLDEREVPYRIVFSASDIACMITAVKTGLGLMIAPERAIPKPLIAARERILPKLPEVRAGVFCREEFDLMRHKSLVTAFISAVQPPSPRFAKLYNGKSDSVRTVQSVR
jgi:DNA-binding transcriptional LysR family regulator